MSAEIEEMPVSWPRLNTGALALAAALCLGPAVAAGFYWSSRYQSVSVARATTGGDPADAPDIIRRYGCGGCHDIPGVPGAFGQVGGSLAGMRQRVFIAGVATNSPNNLVRWIVAPQTLSPATAMPATGITESEARNVAAYLYAQ